MIDFHTHILPGMDDGSRDCAQTLAMLREMARQGVDTAGATPHFYRRENTPAAFLERRARSYALLRPHLTPELPRLLLGAEAAFFPGMAQAEDTALLCIENTRTLLVEMPCRPWGRAVPAELTALAARFIVVLAHVERFWFLQSPATRRFLLEGPCRLQVNAGGLCLWPTRVLELPYLRRGAVTVIGSDCHGTLYRPPCAGRAYGVLAQKLGPEKVQALQAGMAALLEPADK